MTRPLSPRRVFGCYLAGVLLMQAAWILTMPAFRGIDEFDHVYKAAAVARGQWNAPDPAPDGRGGVVTVPGSIVRAASPVCTFYDYVGHDNCFPIRSVGHGEVEVATAAGAYNPAYYLIVGNLARPFDGAGADFAMRTITAVLCGLLIAWAAAIVARWSTTTWPLLAFTVSLTPVLVYSTAIAAPNGVTYASATLVWASLMALSRAETDGYRLALPLSIGSVALVATHTTGAVWLALAALVCVMLRPVRDWLRILKHSRVTWVAAAAVILGATAACAFWIRVQHTNALDTEAARDTPFPFERLPTQQLLWALQAIAAFPLRDEPAPAAVYILWGLPLVALLVALLRRGSRRERIAGVTTLVLLAAVPTILTLMSFKSEGFAWQGRYSLPLWLGITSLAGAALDRTRRGPSTWNTHLLFLLLAIAMTISTVNVGRREIAHGPADPVVAEITAGLVLVAVLTALGALAPLAILRTRRGSPGESPDVVPATPIRA